MSLWAHFGSDHTLAPVIYQMLNSMGHFWIIFLARLRGPADSSFIQLTKGVDIHDALII